MNWLISIPIWGAPYVRTFAEAAAPALLAAVRRLREPAKFMIHTDNPEAIRAALPGQEIEFHAVPGKPTYVALQEGHADAVRSAASGDRVVLLNADLVISGNLLERCAEHFAAGKQAVVLLGIRTTAGRERPPANAAPRDLLAWAWDHRHQIIRDLEWPHGGSMLPTNLFWSAGASTVARGFHLHPAAIIKHDKINFKSTIDGDLLDYFSRDQTHVVTSPDDCSMAEISPPERRFPVRGTHFNPGVVAGSMRSRASATHRWLFEQRIVVRGSGDEITEDWAVAREILRALGEPQQVVTRGVTPTPAPGPAAPAQAPAPAPAVGRDPHHSRPARPPRPLRVQRGVPLK